MKPFFRGLAAAFAFAAASSAAAAQTLVARPPPAAGSIVAAKGGEELQLVRESIWRPALVRQDLLAGDVLRTGETGTLAVLFSDQTQVRIGRNAVLTVKSLGRPVELGLTSGSLWARANRGGEGLRVETPAATTAIRGTDWALAVDGARTTVTVFDGVVEFYNAQGSVTVLAGEAAVASIGSAPTKIVVVSPDDREQMLFYLDLRSAFTLLPATPIGRRAIRAERERLTAIPPDLRTTADWVAAAEVALSSDGTAAAKAAVAAARRGRPTRAEAARLTMVEALIAGSERRYADSARLFAEAIPGLDPERRAVARYGEFFAAALADPTRRIEPPDPALADVSPGAALGQAWLVGFAEGPDAAIAALEASEKRFPDDVVLPAARSRIATLVDRREVMIEGSKRADAIDPDDPWALDARAVVAQVIEQDTDKAVALRRRAVAADPGDADLWNSLALVEDGRDAALEAEAASKRAIEADPYDALSRANYAIFLLDHDRLAEAKVQIDAAAALDPSFSYVKLAEGRYQLQKGDTAAAVATILAASAANPASGNALVLLAAAYYENGDVGSALQQLDNADRLDPNDPTVPVVRTVIALDHYEADEAIRAAREAARRYRGLANFVSPVATTRQGGSYVSEAFRFLTLNSWGRFYGDEAFDPFVSSGYFDEALVGRTSPLALAEPLTGPDLGEFVGDRAFSSLVQGLMLDPLAAAGRSRWTDLLRRPFFDVSAGTGLVWRDGGIGPSGEIEVSSFTGGPVPTSVFANVQGLSSPADGVNNRFETASGVFLAGVQPTISDRIVAFGLYGYADPLVDQGLAADTKDADRRTDAGFGGVGWSHTFADRNVLQAAAWAGSTADDAEAERNLYIRGGYYGGFRSEIHALEQNTGAAVNYMLGFGPVTLRAGAEAGGVWDDSKATYTVTRPSSEIAQTTYLYDQRSTVGQAYLDLLVRPLRTVQFEAGLFGNLVDNEDDGDISRADPRIGIGFMPIEGQWLRAAWRSDTELSQRLSLAPVTTVGLFANPLPIATGGRVQSTIARWDAEWSEHVFTSVEYQHQEVKRLETAIPYSLASFDAAQGRIDRIQATANLWLGWGIGVFGSYAANWSENTSDTSRNGESLPFVPDQIATFGASWVNPAGVRFTLSESYVGARTSSYTRNRDPTTLDPYWTTDASAGWVSPDRHLSLDLSVINIFDADYEIDDGFDSPGRVVLANVRANF